MGLNTPGLKKQKRKAQVQSHRVQDKGKILAGARCRGAGARDKSQSIYFQTHGKAKSNAAEMQQTGQIIPQNATKNFNAAEMQQSKQVIPENAVKTPALPKCSESGKESKGGQNLTQPVKRNQSAVFCRVACHHSGPFFLRGAGQPTADPPAESRSERKERLYGKRRGPDKRISSAKSIAFKKFEKPWAGLRVV